MLPTERNPMRLLRRYAHSLPYLLMVGVFCYALTFAFPQTDDFCTFGRLENNSGGNPLREALYLYNHWTGRYSASFATAVVGWLHGLVPLSLQTVYAACLIAALLVFVATAYLATRTVYADRRGSFALAMLMVSVSLLLMPSRLEGVFWLTGVAVYTLGIFAMLALCDYGTRDSAVDAKGRARIDPATVASIVAAVGFNEFIGLCVGVFLGVRFLLIARDRAHLRQNIAYFAAYAIAFSAALFAPGNFVRDSTISATRHDLGAALRMSWESLSNFKRMHLIPEAPMLAAAILAALAIGIAASSSHRRAEFRRAFPAIAALLAAFPVHVFVYTFLVGDLPPGRVINEAYVMSLLAVCMLAAWSGMTLARIAPIAAARRFAPAAVFFAGLVLASGKDFREVVTSTRDFAPLWAKQQEQRRQRILAAAPGEALTLPAFSRERTDPPIFQGADISADNAYWVNRCVADYYRLGELRLETSAAP